MGQCLKCMVAGAEVIQGLNNMVSSLVKVDLLTLLSAQPSNSRGKPAYAIIQMHPVNYQEGTGQCVEYE